MENRLKNSDSWFFRPHETKYLFAGKKSRGRDRKRRNKCLNLNGNFKIRYEYLDDAIIRLKEMRVDPTVNNPERLGIYSCPVCFYFHIGNTPLMQDPFVVEWVLHLPSRNPDLEIELGKRAYHNLLIENSYNKPKARNALNKKFKSAIRKSWSKC